MTNNLDKLPGGVGDRTPTDQIDPIQLSTGIQIEMEHTNDTGVAQSIAMDHLTEDPKYYSKLVAAGLASEFKPSTGSGLGDTNQRINDTSRVGDKGLQKSNVVGTIGGTSNGKVDGRRSNPIINKTIDIELENQTFNSLEEAMLDEKKRRKSGKGKRKPKPTNPTLWARAKSAARSKFDVYPCVPLDSKALTKNGWKTYEELTIGELILTYNINKDELEWKPILNLNFFENAELIRMYKPTGFSIKCTPNHKWVVQRGHDYSTVELIETKDLPKRARIVICAELKSNENVVLENFSKTDNWTENVINMSSEQRKSFLAASIIYDGWDRGSSSKIEGRHTFGFVQKNSDHLDAGLLAAYLSGYYVSVHDRGYITSASFIRNKKCHSVQNVKFEKTENEDVWCPTTENNTWVMYQNGLITITGNSAYANGWAAKWYKSKGGGWRMSEAYPAQSMEGPFPSDGVMTGSGTNGSGYDFVGYAESKKTMNKQQLKEAIKRMIREIEQDDVSVDAEKENVTITLDRELAQKLHDLLMSQLQSEQPSEDEDEDEDEDQSPTMDQDQLPTKSSAGGEDEADEEQDAVGDISPDQSDDVAETKKKWIRNAIRKPRDLKKNLNERSVEKTQYGKFKLGQRARLAMALRKLKENL